MPIGTEQWRAGIASIKATLQVRACSNFFVGDFCFALPAPSLVCKVSIWELRRCVPKVKGLTFIVCHFFFFFFYIPIKFYSKQTKVTRRCHEEHGNT